MISNEIKFYSDKIILYFKDETRLNLILKTRRDYGCHPNVLRFTLWIVTLCGGVYLLNLIIFKFFESNMLTARCPQRLLCSLASTKPVGLFVEGTLGRGLFLFLFFKFQQKSTRTIFLTLPFFILANN